MSSDTASPETPRAKKKVGRPKKYEGIDGAPMFSTRMDPKIYHHIRQQSEGARNYVERLVAQDMERTKPDA